MIKNITNVVISAFLILGWATRLQATTYYIKATGNDSLSGTSQAKAWKTANPLYSVSIVAGDSILFNGGDTLNTQVYVSASDSGTALKPIVLSSYGVGAAILNANKSWAIFIYNTGGIVIENIELLGAGSKTNTQSGLFYYADNYAKHIYKHLKVSNIYIHGFGADGVTLGCDDTLYRGIQDLNISRCNINDNGKSGISSYDRAGLHSTLYAFKKIHIAYCNVFRNGINGIVIGGVDSCIIEHCCAAFTGITTYKGSVGIWAWSSRNVVIQHCISHHTITTGNDGDGFDLDGGSDHCVVQYCYSYNNAGCGYMHCDYPYSRPTNKNIIRYCLSQNDGRKHLKGGSSYLFNSWGSGLDSCYIYNNDAYITDNDSSVVTGLAAYIQWGYDSSSHIRHCAARNNIFCVDGVNYNSLVSFSGGKTRISDTNVILQGNTYFSSNTKSHVFYVESKPYYSFGKWQDSAHQELVNGNEVGDTINPQLNNAGKAQNMLNTDSLIYINAYKLLATSPMIDAGLNLDSIFGMDIGKTDFYGNKPKHGHKQDIGMYEYVHPLKTIPVNKNDAYISVYPEPAHQYVQINLTLSALQLQITLYDLYGRIILLQSQNNVQNFRLNISEFLAGTYILTVNTGSGLYTCKIVKN